jgi:hypothetical protein
VPGSPVYAPELVFSSYFPSSPAPATVPWPTAYPAAAIYPLADQLRQRAAMGGEKERAELAAFETLLAMSIADALVAQLREEAAAHGVAVWTWLERQGPRRSLAG